MRVRVPLFSGTHEAPYYALDGQVVNEELWNMIPLVDETGQHPNILVPFPGAAFGNALKTTGDLNGRGLVAYADPSASFDEKLAAIVNNSLYTYANANNTTPGTVNSAINTGYGHVKMLNFQSASTSTVVWARHRTSTSAVGYYDPSTDTQDASAVIGSGFTANSYGTPTTIDYLNRQLIGTDGLKWATSAPASTQLDTTDRIAEAEAYPDVPIATVVSENYLYVFGKRSIEIYQNTGSGKPPFTRLPTGVLPYGLLARNSYVVHDQSIYFINAKYQPMVLRGNQAQRIGNRYVDTAFDQASPIVTSTGDGPTVMSCTLYGQPVIIFQFLTWTSATVASQQGTWVYYPLTGLWGRLGADGGTSGTWQFVETAMLGPTVYALHKDDGKLYTLDLNAFVDNPSGNNQTSLVRTMQVSSSTIGGEPGQWMFISKAVLRCATNEDVATRLAMRYSDDGGRTWSTSKNPVEGATSSLYGDAEATWYSLGRTKERMFEFSFTGNSTADYLSMHFLELEVELGKQ